MYFYNQIENDSFEFPSVCGIWKERKSNTLVLSFSQAESDMTEKEFIQDKQRCINTFLKAGYTIKPADKCTEPLLTLIKKENSDIVIFNCPTNLALINIMPTGAVIYGIQEILTAGGRKGIESLPERKKQINHSSKYSVTKGDPFKNEQGQTIIRHDMSDKRSYLRFSIPDNIVDEKLGYGIYAKKMLFMILEKINEQVYRDGEITRDYVTFPAQELIDRGLYKSPRSAREGFESAMDILTSIKAQGELWYSKRKSVSVYQLSVLFPTARYEEGGQCKVFLNQQIGDWKFIYQAFSILPKYYYELPNKPSELIYYIFFIARQHTEGIKKRGHFTISFRAIQQALHLPSEKETEHPKRDILDVIYNAIDEIDKAQIKYFHSEDLLSLYTENDNGTNITEILNEGYLNVNLTGDFAAPFIKIENDKIKGLKEAERRRQKALEAKQRK